MKKAFITGVTGQDGSYLAEFLLKKNYEVHGMKRRSSSINTKRIDHLYSDPHNKNTKFFLHHGDLLDSLRLNNLINDIRPDEIYNLGAQSHVAVSFDNPEYTADVDAIGPLRLLEVIRNSNMKKKIRFFQASTSEIYGNQPFQKLNEKSSFMPSSPYGTSKLFGYWITKNYRDSYGIFAANGIMFNHESPVRGETFVTKKIIRGLYRIKTGIEKKLYLGNLDAERDWGHAKDYVKAMWLILQNNQPDDFVISTGKKTSVREFINIVAKKLKLNLSWRGKGLSEVGINIDTNKIIIEIDKKYIRPNEVNTLLGTSNKIRRVSKWKPVYTLDKIIEEMINYEKHSVVDG